jgi:hypothetical protein
MDSDLLETMKVDLRAKYLKDRDDLQRQVGNDPDMWADDKLFETAQKVIEFFQVEINSNTNKLFENCSKGN